jgi:hypothetical protein
MATKIGILQQQNRAPGAPGRVGVQQPGGPRDVTSGFSRPVIRESSAGLEIDQQQLDRFSNVFVRKFAADQSEIQRKYDEQKAFDDKLAGLRDAASFTGIDGDGYVKRIEASRDRSIEYQAAYQTAATNNMLAGIQADLSNRFNEIQNDTTGDWRSKQPRMMAILESRLEMMPAEIQTPMRDFGLGQIMGRSASIANEEANREHALTVETVKARGVDAQRSAYNAALAGRDPTIHVEALEQTLTEMVGLGEISEEVKVRTLAANRDQIVAVTAQARMADHVFKGNVNPDNLERFAVQMEEGGDFTMEIQTGIDSRSGQPITQRMSAAKMRDDIADPKLRSDVAASMRKAANLKAQANAAYAKHEEFVTAFDGLGLFDELPTQFTDDFNKVVGKMVVGGAMADPMGREQVIGMMAKAKHVPPDVVANLRNRLRSGNPADVRNAVEFWHKMTELEVSGMNVGAMLRDDVSEEDQRFLDVVAEQAATIGARTGEDDKAFGDELMRVIDKIESNPLSKQEAIAIFNQGAEKEKTFYAQLNGKWAEMIGGEQAPPEVQTRFERAVQASMAAGVDKQTAFDNAVERVLKTYEGNSIFLNGYARVGDNSLTNPAGYKPDFVPRNPKDMTPYRTYEGKKEYQWASDYTRNAVLDQLTGGNLMLTPGKLEELKIMLADPNAVGTSIFLEPTDGNRAAPNYRIHVKFKDGQQLLRGANDLPIQIDPGMKRAQEQGRFDFGAKEEKILTGYQRKLEELNANVLLENPLQQNLDPLSNVKIFDEASSVFFADLDAEARRQYNVEASKLFDGMEVAMENLRKTTPAIYRGEAVTPEVLVKPGAYGYDVAKAAVDEIEKVLPDGTGGTFLMNVALVESKFGKAEGTFRNSGDMGIWQINAGSMGAYKEIKNRIARGNNPVATAARKLESELKINLAGATKEDLKKPLVSAAFARLYFVASTTPIPQDVEGQARLWKDFYNTYLGKGSVDGFIRTVGKFVGR